MPILGIIASQMQGHLTPTTGYVSIATQTVGSGGASSVTFSGIPSVYKHLQIRGIARATDTGATGFVGMQFNSDTGSNYSRHIILADGVNNPPQGYSYASQTKAGLSYVPAASSGANMFGGFIADILDYSSTSKNKVIRSLGGYNNNGSSGFSYLNLNGSSWMSTNAVTSITLFTDANIAQYSSFALYGIQGA
jgi:hypothetical protein